MANAKKVAPQPVGDGVVEKRKVTMVNITAIPAHDGNPEGIKREELTDYVPLEILDAYVEDAKTRWQVVDVDHEGGHNSGPGKDDGDTDFEAHLGVARAIERGDTAD